jgi:hypothetical protein
MPQKTNLNTYPYFDDFNPDNIYHKILFKPGYPIQARELTTLQSILQNQIEQFGNWAFQEGSPVVPGSITYNDRYYAVELKNNFNGIEIFNYLDSITGKTIFGQSSGVRAKIISCINSQQSERNNTTIYVNYIDSDYENSEYVGFSDGENLLLEEDTIFTINVNPDSFLTIRRGEAFASTIDGNCNSVGSQLSVAPGIYFVRGYFVKSDSQFIILDQYSNFPSYSVGFEVVEDIITSEEDQFLNDNAKGFSNYAAPGADRLGISLVLTKVGTGEEFPDNFIKLLEVNEGVIKNTQTDPRLNELGKELARRTYDESGDYYVKSPTISAKETLNNLLGNGGIYNKNQVTFNENVPDESLGTYQISPLKAYIKGYEVNVISPVFLDFQKARTVKTLENQSVVYNTGSTLTLNRVYGSPTVGFSTYTLSLRNERVGINSSSPSGKEIGIARVYDFSLESGSYDSLIPNTNQWDISLYDVQTYTEIGINEVISLNAPSYIKGKSSGASGFLRFTVSNSGILTAYNISGNFISGEKLIFNDVENENTRVSTSITSYTIDNVKSLYGLVGTSYTFSADTVQTTKKQFTNVEISQIDSILGISTAKSNIPIFSGVVNKGDLVSYTIQGKTYPSYAKVNNVTATTLTLSGVTTVIGVCDGELPQTNALITDFKLLGTKRVASENESLYTKLPKDIISDVDLTNSNLTVKRQFEVTITSNSTGNISANEDETFLPFDEERYVLITENGITESLTSDKFDLNTYTSSGGLTIKFNGLSVTNSAAKLIATLNKTKVKTKLKNRSKIKSVVIDKSRLVGSGIGETTLNNGLIYGNYPYGTRVEDDEVCLLQSDITKIYGIFEKSDSSNLNSDPTTPRMTLSRINGISGTIDDIQLGEIFIGEVSNAVAIYAEKVDLGTIGFIYLNSNSFIRGETITFESSLTTATVNSTIVGDKDITSSYILDNGQRNTIYDYSRIIRKQTYKEPIRKIKVYFESASYSPSDIGDITTINSYQNFDYSEISNINQVRNSDIIDVRPRVINYQVSEGARSPFEFMSRIFSETYNNASKYVLASDENINLSYSFYLPRVDKIFLSKDALFQLKSGEPAETNQFPYSIDDSIEVATIYVPAYTFNASDVSITKKDYKRYTMSDIGKLETRIENLEYYSTLSLLEKETANLAIFDSNGNPRFKSGFFVDNFTTTLYQQKDTIVKNSIDPSNNELRPTHYTTNCDLILGESSIILNKDFSVDINYSNDFISSNIKKTGNIITLDYVEVVENNQPFSTRVTEVTSYSTSEYVGGITLSPSSDTWISQRKTLTTLTDLDGDITETSKQITLTEDTEETGFSAPVWNGGSLWTKDLISTEQIPYMRKRNIEFRAERMKPYTRLYAFFDNVDVNKHIIPKLIEVQMTSGVFQVGETITAKIEDSFGSWLSSIGTVPDLLKQKLNKIGISIETISDLRNLTSTTDSRNNPATNIILDYFRSSNYELEDGGSFRLCTPDHKIGPYNNPTKKYNTNPYDRSQIIPSLYSSTSNILNIDTFSLSYRGQSNFYGNLKIGMKLTGQTSNATAIIKDIRLITDDSGTVIGSFRIPNTDNINQIGDRFTSGEKVFRLTNSTTNSLIPGIVFTYAYEKFYSQGTLNNIEEIILSVSPPSYAPEILPPPPSPSPSASPSYYSQPEPTPKSETKPPAPIPPTVTPIQVALPPKVVEVNKGGPVYANAAQQKIVNAYKELHPNSNVTTAQQVARRLDIKIDTNPSGTIPKNDGNQIVKALQQAGANVVKGPGSAPRQDPPRQNSPRQDSPRQNSPRQDPPRQNPPRRDPPRQDPPRQNPPRQDPPRQNPPRQDPPRQNPPPSSSRSDNSNRRR